MKSVSCPRLTKLISGCRKAYGCRQGSRARTLRQLAKMDERLLMSGWLSSFTQRSRQHFRIFFTGRSPSTNSVNLDTLAREELHWILHGWLHSWLHRRRAARAHALSQGGSQRSLSLSLLAVDHEAFQYQTLDFRSHTFGQRIPLNHEFEQQCFRTLRDRSIDACSPRRL